MRLVSQVLESVHQVENPSLIDDLFHICESGMQAYNRLMPVDCYESLRSCLLRLLGCVSFGDNYDLAFDL